MRPAHAERKAAPAAVHLCVCFVIVDGLALFCPLCSDKCRGLRRLAAADEEQAARTAALLAEQAVSGSSASGRARRFCPACGVTGELVELQGALGIFAVSEPGAPS